MFDGYERRERKITRRTAAYLCDVKKQEAANHDNNRHKFQERAEKKSVGRSKAMAVGA
jgi:hypothetical protein